jgi:crotonobetainyl-CoA:carnitine CoA-transferase CaiB-like acyl-CoA transferase
LLPLSDLRVLSVEQFGAGPWGTMQLADLGAEIIKVEDPSVGGDVGRYVPPYNVGSSSLYFESFNRNKRSVALDLRHPRGKEVFRRIVSKVDALFSNLRGDQPESLGLTYDQLADVNPQIVCCSLSGFGMTGPRSREGGYDHTVQGLAGWQSVTGEPDGPPAKSGLSLVDFSAGYVAAIAILAAVWRARRVGKGCDVDLSLFETALAELSYMATWVASRGYQPVRRPQSAHQTLVPFQNFEAADGWIVVACPKNSLFAKLCSAIGAPHLATEQRFSDFEQRDQNRDDLIETLSAIFKSDSASSWVERLTKAGVPSAPINDIGAALKDPQALAREATVEFEHPVLGPVRTVASPFKMADLDLAPQRAPLLGEHTASVLTELCGYSDGEVGELAAQGVFGSGLPSDD